MYRLKESPDFDEAELEKIDQVFGEAGKATEAKVKKKPGNMTNSSLKPGKISEHRIGSGRPIINISKSNTRHSFHPTVKGSERTPLHNSIANLIAQ